MDGKCLSFKEMPAPLQVGNYVRPYEIRNAEMLIRVKSVDYIEVDKTRGIGTEWEQRVVLDVEKKYWDFMVQQSDEVE